LLPFKIYFFTTCSIALTALWYKPKDRGFEAR
jgi:hypothetical protein